MLHDANEMQTRCERDANDIVSGMSRECHRAPLARSTQGSVEKFSRVVVVIVVVIVVVVIVVVVVVVVVVV